MSSHTNKGIHINEECQRLARMDPNNYVLSDTDTVGQREQIIEEENLAATARITKQIHTSLQKNDNTATRPSSASVPSIPNKIIAFDNNGDLATSLKQITSHSSFSSTRRSTTPEPAQETMIHPVCLNLEPAILHTNNLPDGTSTPEDYWNSKISAAPVRYIRSCTFLQNRLHRTASLHEDTDPKHLPGFRFTAEPTFYPISEGNMYTNDHYSGHCRNLKLSSLYTHLLAWHSLYTSQRPLHSLYGHNTNQSLQTNPCPNHLYSRLTTESPVGQRPQNPRTLPHPPTGTTQGTRRA